MNSFAFARNLRLIAVAAVLCTSNAIHPTAAQVGSATKITIIRSNQSVVLSWLGENEVVYQLESSPDLAAFGSLGSMIIGNGSSINFPVPIGGQSHIFFRLAFPGIQSATFDPGTGTLKIIGDNLDNIIIVSRDAAGNLRINNGTIFITGGTPTIANTTLIEIFGRAGADQLSLDETNGALPKASLFGEGGNDILTGGSGNDMLNGGPGNDTLLGKEGTDTLLGGDDNDTLAGGVGGDQVFGEAGNDRLIWNPGDETDVDEGGTETDTVEVNGGNGAEVFTTAANGTRAIRSSQPCAFLPRYRLLRKSGREHEWRERPILRHGKFGDADSDHGRWWSGRRHVVWQQRSRHSSWRR